MTLQNYSLDQDKSFQKLLSLQLGYVYLAHCTLIWYVLHVIFALDIKKKLKKLIYLLLFFYSLFVYISQFALATSP